MTRIAALDQDFYPDTIYTAPSLAYVRDQMKKAKRLGLNLLRCHIKVCEPNYLRAADEVGMLVWYEVPSWNDFNHFTKMMILFIRRRATHKFKTESFISFEFC